ncbi:MAG: class I SAM-dependent methyltransferase [Archaeoglobus sp.]|uniref:class I SAM-dependent methyltransferase n=1 Tax=Archaeoglobus sp. TaxID=1872626 RepID=UPI001D6FB638|nr:class I SAM-dependent methyltransferase [Archaeoglobus sp.]MBO8180452.1 class I SAM-dependent methyltransferase [Archaeoglobus sp.]
MKKKIINLGYKILNSRHLSRLFSSYRLTWELAGITRSTAMDAVLRGVKSEEEFWSSGEKVAAELRKFVNKDSIILDVGCGMGRVEKFIAPYCKEIHGVDVSGKMIKLARKNLKDCRNVFFHKNNGKDLRIFPENTFDFIFSVITLQHLEKEDAYIYIEEIYRVLKPGGKVYLQFPNFLSDEVFKWFVNYAKKGSRHIARVRGYTMPEVEKIMRYVGFRNLSIEDRGEDLIAIGEK